MSKPKTKKTAPKLDERWSQSETGQPQKAENRFRQNKNLYQKFTQAPKQSGNMPRALGGHR